MADRTVNVKLLADIDGYLRNIAVAHNQPELESTVRELLDREIEHAAAGRGGHVRIQMNGLADRSMVGSSPSMRRASSSTRSR